MDKASVEGFWARNAVQTTKSWIRDGLRERAITRDLKWGIPVPKEGYEDKVFYVWFDAPIGYISITANYTDNWRDWWQNREEVELFQFIGKDNIPFHTVIFPATLLATQDPWTMLHHMSSSEYLNYEGGKFSKSRGMGIFGNDVQDTGIPADMWRFYLFYNRPEKADVLFTWKDFQEKINGELIGNISNLVHRTLSFIDRFYDGIVPEGEVDEELQEEIAKRIEVIESHFERSELREALRNICYLSSVGNKAFQDGEPWKNRTENPEQSASLLRTLIYLLRDLGVLLQPFIPTASAQLLSYLNSEEALWASMGEYSSIKKINKPDYLFRRLEDDLIETLRERYSGSQESREEKESSGMGESTSVAATFAEKVTLRVSRIAEIEKHPNGDKLYILQLDTGSEEPTTIVSSIVPFYKEEELLGRNIVLVQNLKPANFRGVRSRGMLLAASDKEAEFHETCEVIFADQYAVGTELLPEGLEAPEDGRTQLKADLFFSLPVYTEGGVVKVEGRAIGTSEAPLKVEQYTDGVVC